jgi:hypothetical protein
MMHDTINRIKEELQVNFANVFAWFDVQDALFVYRPQNNGWSIQAVLEHISLANHYLLILIKKATIKALERAKKTTLAELPIDYDLDWGKMALIGQHQSFVWNRPDHMEPSCLLSVTEVKATLLVQLQICIDLLNQMPNGEGVLYNTQMSVNGLGKIDVYHYLYFLALYAKRHIAQMKKIQNEYRHLPFKSEGY